MSSIIAIFLVFTFVASISAVIFLLFKYVRTEVVYLDAIEIPDKEELLNISYIRESIEIEKIETPKIYNNIFYRVYFIVDTTDDVINDSMNELQSNLHLLFERKGFIDRKTEYCCTISNYDNRIYFLDRMRHKYKQVERY